jgi:hypothetical protein
MATKARQDAAGVGRAAPAGAQPARQPRKATVNLPFVTAEFRVPEIHLPSIHLPSIPVRTPRRSDLTEAVSAVRPHLPSREQVGLYAGLAALGVLEVVEWPVVLAIAATAAITQHARAESEAGDHQDGRDGNAQGRSPATSAGTAQTQGTTRARATTQRQRSVPARSSTRRTSS